MVNKLVDLENVRSFLISGIEAGEEVNPEFIRGFAAALAYSISRFQQVPLHRMPTIHQQLEDELLVMFDAINRERVPYSEW